jgi:pyruvate formate lyase activating enzyme
MTVHEVLNAVGQDRAFYETTGGGVTLSGGEPTLQFDFCRELLRQLKKEGIHTAVETSGYAEWRIIHELAELTDLFLYDIKSVDRKKHLAFTGVPNDVILMNLQRLIQLGKNLVIRYPLIPAHNDSDEEICALTDVAVKNGVEEIHIMPYHRFGVYKYQLLGIKPSPDGIRRPTRDDIERVSRKILERSNVQVRING